MVDETRPRSNSLARALLRAHEAVAARVARERCFFCGLPLTGPTCPDCDGRELAEAYARAHGEDDGTSWR